MFLKKKKKNGPLGWSVPSRSNLNYLSEGRTNGYIKLSRSNDQDVRRAQTSRKWANGQNIYDSENKIDLRGTTVPALGLDICI